MTVVRPVPRRAVLRPVLGLHPTSAGRVGLVATRATLLAAMGPRVRAPTTDESASRTEPATFLVLAVVRLPPGKAFPPAKGRILGPALGVAPAATYTRTSP